MFSRISSQVLPHDVLYISCLQPYPVDPDCRSASPVGHYTCNYAHCSTSLPLRRAFASVLESNSLRSPLNALIPLVLSAPHEDHPLESIVGFQAIYTNLKMFLSPFTFKLPFRPIGPRRHVAMPSGSTTLAMVLSLREDSTMTTP